MRLGSNQAPYCPFFLRDTDNSIECEGIVDGSRLTLTASTESIKQQEKLFCCGDYENCELYTATAQKYPDLAMDKTTLVKVVNGISDNNLTLATILEKQKKILELLITISE